jgi:hypothetical protein
MRKSEQNLDLFWRTADQNYKTKIGRTLQEALCHVLTEGRQLERTPKWIEPVKKRTKKLNPKDSKFEDMLAQLKVSFEDRPVREITNLKSKVKPKGTAQASNVTVPEAILLDHEHPPSQTADIQPRMKVTKRALKVFSILFHTPSQSDQPGEIPWQDFLHAMTCTGFVPQSRMALFGNSRLLRSM